MVSFNNLPNELVLQIISLLPPGDLESFSSTCRLVNSLAGQSLDEHRDFKGRYRHWLTVPLVASNNCLYVLLRAILKNPRIAWYVETLEVQELLEGWIIDAKATPDSGPNTLSHTGVMSDDERAMFERLSRSVFTYQQTSLKSGRVRLKMARRTLFLLS